MKRLVCTMMVVNGLIGALLTGACDPAPTVAPRASLPARAVPEPGARPAQSPPRPAVPAAAAPTRSCPDATPTAAELWSILGSAVHARFVAATPRLFTAELDGAPPREAVFAADRVDPDGGEGALWVFRCTAGDWSLAAETAFAIDAGWDGTFDGTPGLKAARAEHLLADRDVIRVEWLDMRGGYDPRFTLRSFELWTLRGTTLERVFDCATEETSASGPDRAGRTFQRAIRFVTDTLPARIRVTTRSSWDPGAGESAPDDGRPESETNSGEYTFNGTRFATTRTVCGEATR